jgi:hypothetical protein
MNYRHIYENIIKNRKLNKVEGYTENHHIIPRSLGGTDTEDNLVKLSAREHFLCHYLLAKMFKKETFEWYKMNNAFMFMKCESISHNKNRYFNSRLYEALKLNFSSVMSLLQKGKGNSQYGTMWISNIELKETKKIQKTEQIPDGWIKGRRAWNRIAREEEKEIEKEEKKNYIWISNLKLKETKRIQKTEPVPDGWIHGRNKWKRINSENAIEKRKNSMWISNIELEETKKIQKTEPIPDGWVKGARIWKKIAIEKEKEISIVKYKQKAIKKCEENINTKNNIKHKLEAEKTWEQFKTGNFNSIKDFVEKEYNKSYCWLISCWSRFIYEYNIINTGRNKLSSKIAREYQK